MSEGALELHSPRYFPLAKRVLVGVGFIPTVPGSGSEFRAKGGIRLSGRFVCCLQSTIVQMLLFYNTTTSSLQEVVCAD